MEMIFAALIAVQATQPNCAKTEYVYEFLSEKRGEDRKGYGITNDGVIVEFWAGPESWTTIVTGSDGQSCIVANGTDWGYAPVVKEPDL